jgi:stage II sporulation protein D
VHDDTKSQVYKGLPGRDPRLEKAVHETAGRVLTWRGKIIRAYYSAACGGTTRGLAEWTGKREIPPLSGVTCGFCDSRGRWSADLSLEEIERRLGERLSGMRIRRVEVSERTRSGRPAKIRIEGRGSRVEIDAAEFRELFDIRTTLFHLRQDDKVLHLRGSGDGHGVGLCQVGAQAMARAGWSAEKILAHYYPGAALRGGYGTSTPR